MPWNGSGVFTRTRSWVADRDSGLNITASLMDGDTDDIAAGLEHCLTRNGETTPLANIPMNGFRVTGAGDAVNNRDYTTLRQVRSAGFVLNGPVVNGGITVNGVASLNGDVNAAAHVLVGSTDESVSPSTGALIVTAGGLGVHGNINAGLNITGLNLIATAAIWQGTATPTANAISGMTLVSAGNVLAQAGGFYGAYVNSSGNADIAGSVWAGGNVTSAGVITTNINCSGAIWQGTAPPTGNAISAVNLLASANATVAGNLVAGGVYGNVVHSYGNLDAAGTISAGAFNTAGNVSAGGVYSNYIHSYGNIDAPGTITGGYITSSGDVSAGNAVWGNTGSFYTLACTGNAAMNNQLDVYGILVGHSTLLYHGEAHFYSFLAAHRSAAGIALHDTDNNSAAGMWNQALALQFGQTDQSGNAQVTWALINNDGINAYKPGGGTWGALSDRRVKRDIAPYRRGLDAIIGLRPVSFAYTGRGGVADNGRQYVGFVADEVLDIMPEMVGRLRTRLDPGDAEDTELLTTNCTPLIFALTNAVQELADKVAAQDRLIAQLAAGRS